jgi:cytochrome c oxidase subunit 2
VFVVVMLLLLGALFRPRSAQRDARPGQGDSALGESGETLFVVVGGLAVPALVLAGMTILTARTLGAIAASPAPALTVEVIGHLWWWEVRYPAQELTTANEIHIPVGQPVEVRLSSPDVIHSLWVPQLMGKMDLVPGQENVLTLQADHAGAYRGQCAEYCGLQHSRMAFLVVAEPPEAFAGWLRAQAQPAVQPTDAFLAQGAQAFAREGCIGCHVIRYGTGPVGTAVGPDLTHVGSRRTLAAGTLPNTLGHMAGWIGNPQALKAGNYMPTLPLAPDSLRALAAYLESLE